MGTRSHPGSPAVWVAPGSPAPGAQRARRDHISSHAGASCGFTPFLVHTYCAVSVSQYVHGSAKGLTLQTQLRPSCWHSV